MSDPGTRDLSEVLDDEPLVKTSDELEGVEREHDASAQEENEEPGTGPDERGPAVGIQRIAENIATKEDHDE